MKKILLLLLALVLASPVAAQQSDTCNKYFQVNQGATALTKVISGVAGQAIRLCGIALSGGAATSTFSMSYGTGTNCATGAVVLYPLVNVPINGAYIDHTGLVGTGPPRANASNVPNDVCIVTTGTGPVSIMLYYAQF